MTDDVFYTDAYFTKTRNCLDNTVATYGVFIRRDVICAVDIAIDFLKKRAPNVTIVRHFAEGQFVPAERPIFSYIDVMADVVELETQLLQRVGLSCVCAYNAFKEATSCPDIPFLDMHARHAAGTDMVIYAGYGAYVGSNAAKMQGARGFVGTSVSITAKFYGNAAMGTMPHALIGYAATLKGVPATLRAVQLFLEHNPNDIMVTALVDYHGQEVTDAKQVADWWYHSDDPLAVNARANKKLGMRLDTHGGRFMDILDYDLSVEIVGGWIHKRGEWTIVKHVMGDDAFEIASDAVRDRVRGILFGKGVSAASIIYMRQCLDAAGYKDVQIVASSGFNPRKCQIMAKVGAPIDMIGTGSFLPETLSESFTTADIYAYNGVFSVKVGREGIFRDAFKEVSDILAGKHKVTK